MYGAISGQAKNHAASRVPDKTLDIGLDLCRIHLRFSVLLPDQPDSAPFVGGEAHQAVVDGYSFSDRASQGPF